MKSMDFFVWQGRSRGFGQQAARLRSGTGLQAGVRPARVGGVNSTVYSRRAQRGQAEKDAISWCVMGWDWYYVYFPIVITRSIAR